MTLSKNSIFLKLAVVLAFFMFMFAKKIQGRKVVACLCAWSFVFY